MPNLRVADLDDLDPCELAGIPSAIEAHLAAVRAAWAGRSEQGAPGVVVEP